MGEDSEIIEAQAGDISVPEGEGPSSLLVKGIRRELAAADDLEMQP